MKTTNAIERIFDLLDDWRNLPAYQLERRADIFFAIYLPELLKSKFGIDIEFVIPEFPVRLGTIYSESKHKNPNLSFKIDYVAVSNKMNKVYLVELKTDIGSRRESQDLYLDLSQEKNIRILVDGILEIYKATSSKKKYDYLLELLSKVGWIDYSTNKNISKDYDIEILYIQPSIGDFGDKMPKKPIITFDYIQEFLSTKNDGISQRFAESLKRWESNPNE